MKRWSRYALLAAALLGAAICADWEQAGAQDALERGFLDPPAEARPHAYWLWLNGYVDGPAADQELVAMKETGFSGALLFDMGARGDKAIQPPAGPAFLSDAWLNQLRASLAQAKRLGLQMDLSVISSWDLGGHWIEPRHASMGLYSSETVIEGGKPLDLSLPFPLAPPAAPKGADGRPAFWRDVAVLALRNARRAAGHDIILRLDPEGVHTLREVTLDNGAPGSSPITETMTPVKEFSVAVSTAGVRDADFHEVVQSELPAQAGLQRFALKAGTQARYVRLRLLSGHNAARPRWTLGEFAALDEKGVNVAAARVADTRRNGAMVVRATAALGYDGEWNQDNLHDGETEGPRGVFATAGPPPLVFSKSDEVIDLSARVEGDRLRWNAPALGPGTWTVLRYVCMNTGERLKVPSPASDGWATDHLNPEATRAHMDYVIGRLRGAFGDLWTSGLSNLYLASYEVRGVIWSPGFAKEFQRRRGYEMTRFIPAIFGSTVDDEETTARFLFDYRKTLGETLIDAYYNSARDAAHKAGLTIKSEAGGPGPPVHNVPVDALLANSAVDEIQGEFWPFWPNADGLWVVKETAAAAHIYGKPRVHMEAFTSFEAWREGPQDLKPSADRVFCEGGNHMVWHTWTHAPPEAGKPGWVYGAGTHFNRNVTWQTKARPFLDYLSRSSFLLQRGRFVADVLYYYGDGGYRFVGPRKDQPGLGPGYDYDVANTDVILNRLETRDGRLTLPDGMGYAVLALPESEEVRPEVLAKIEKLVAAGATVIGPKPLRAQGLEGFPKSDAIVRELSDRLWGDLDGREKKTRSYGKGRIIWGTPLRQVLNEMKIAQDFAGSEAVDFIHRRDGDAEIYFVRNKQPQPVAVNLSFRVANREPEFWDPQTGKIERAAIYRQTQGRMETPVTLGATGSIFVVFRRPARTDAIASITPETKIVMRDDTALIESTRNGSYTITHADGRKQTMQFSGLPTPIALDNDWSVEFEKGQETPERFNFASLGSWTKQPDPALKYFSGTARYRKSFTVPAGWKTAQGRIMLDLGSLWTIGEAWLNGKPLGVLWTAPFEVDCTEALREGPNELIVEVSNTWYNRLIGDAALPADKRMTRTNITTSGGKPWAKLEPLDSGLLGPVRLVAVAQAPIVDK
jgi:hypothetical protein